MEETQAAQDAAPTEDPEDEAQQYRPPSVDDVLHEAAQKVVQAIPSERSLVFLYEKATNHLSVHSISDEHGERVSFPPVMGMISACFLHKRCQRMQQPHQHRALHHEYDVPNDMQMDSILCAPIILHHRVIGVIELINRFDPDDICDANTNPSTATPKKIQSSSEDGTEIRLHRSNTMKPQVKTGFSLKDEQKLMQFASHVGQSIVTTLKEIASGETQAELRDNHTQSAMELLNMLNEKLEYHPNESPELISRPVWKRSVPKPVSSQGNASVELIPDPVIDVPTLARIIKVQAIFRGRKERSRQDLPAMIQHSREMKRLREENSAKVVQTAVRRRNKRKQFIRERKAIKVIESVYAHYSFRLKLDKQRHTRRRGTRKPSVMQTTTVKRTSVAIPETHGIETFRARLASAEAIQKHFRGHQTRKMVKKMTGISNLGKGLRNIIKLQAFFRGSATRKRIQKLLKEKEKRSVRVPTTVCVRIGKYSNQQSHDEYASACVYPLPDRQSRAHLIINRYNATRHRLEELFDSARTLTLNCAHQSGSEKESTPSRVWKSSKCAASNMNDSWISAESRRLLPSFEAVPALNRPRPRVCDSNTFTSVGALAKVFPTYSFDPAKKKGKQSPSAVEFASELLVKAPERARTSPSSHRNKSVQAGNNFSRSIVKNDAPVKSSEDYRKYAFAAAIGAHDGLSLPTLRPQVIQNRGKQSQVSTNSLWCFVPASSKVIRRHESTKAISVISAQHLQTRSVAPTQPGLSFDKTQAYSRNRHFVVPEACSLTPD